MSSMDTEIHEAVRDGIVRALGAVGLAGMALAVLATSWPVALLGRARA